jgi:hypothetical protein
MIGRLVYRYEYAWIALVENRAVKTVDYRWLIPLPAVCARPAGQPCQVVLPVGSSSRVELLLTMALDLTVRTAFENGKNVTSVVHL